MLSTKAKNDFLQESWTKVRQFFSLDDTYIHLALSMITPHPSIVREAIEHHRNGFDTNPTLYYRNKDHFEKEVLDKAAAYLQTDAEQIAITESTTMGLAIVYTGLQMQAGDEILTSHHEHYAALEILRFKAKRDKVDIKSISLYSDSTTVTQEEIVDNIIKGITDKTRLVAMTWVHSCTGVKLPIKLIAKAISKINGLRREQDHILLVVDGLHGFGVEDFVIDELNCDFFIAGCHKWMFGPRGTGLVWGNKKAWNRVIPIMTSFKWEAFWSWFNSKNPDEICPKAWLCAPGGFQAYEHRWSLGKAFDFHLSIGKKMIAERIQTLNSYCKKEISKISGVTLYTPTDPFLSSGMVCFDVQGMDPDDVVERLLEKRILSGQTPYRSSHCRFSPGILNDFAEIDRAVDALKAVVEEEIK